MMPRIGLHLIARAAIAGRGRVNGYRSGRPAHQQHAHGPAVVEVCVLTQHMTRQLGQLNVRGIQGLIRRFPIAYGQRHGVQGLGRDGHALLRTPTVGPDAVNGAGGQDQEQCHCTGQLP